MRASNPLWPSLILSCALLFYRSPLFSARSLLVPVVARKCSGLKMASPSPSASGEEKKTKKILVARKGRLQQRYDGEYRLVAGCVPYRVGADGQPQLLMVSTPNRDDLVFPKGGWEDDEDVHEAACREAMEEAGVKGAINRTALGMWVMRSKSSPVSSDDSPRGACKGYIFALEVAEELQQWPEQDTHGRHWVSPADAYRLCRYDWMREALSALLDRLLPEPKPAAAEGLGDHTGVCMNMMVKAAADRAVALC